LKKSRIPPAPASLSVEARRWWKKLVSEYDIVDAAGLLLLGTALEAFDRMRDAQATLERDGATLSDRFGQVKAHPATVTERDSRAAMLAGLRALNLDLEPLQPRHGRPSGR
jgi:P27 family predicted phage terminase small subunit